MYIMCSDHFGAVCAGPYRSAFRCRSIGLEICLPGRLSFGAFDGRGIRMLFCCSKDEGSRRILLLHFVYIISQKVYLSKDPVFKASRVSENRADRGAVGITGDFVADRRKNLFGNSFEFRF